MTETEKQALSKAVAEKYGIDASFSRTYENEYIENSYIQREEITDITWLHDDSARCFNLMVEHGFTIFVWSKNVSAHAFDSTDSYDEMYKDHPTKQEATRIAILRALLAKD